MTDSKHIGYQVNTYENGTCVGMSKVNRGRPYAEQLYRNAIKRLRNRKKNGKIHSGKVTFEGRLMWNEGGIIP